MRTDNNNIIVYVCKDCVLNVFNEHLSREKDRAMDPRERSKTTFHVEDTVVGGSCL